MYLGNKTQQTRRYGICICLYLFVFGQRTMFMQTRMCLVKWEQTRSYSIVFAVRKVTNANVFGVRTTNAIVFVARN